MKFKNLNNFENYKLYENGDIINSNTNKKIKISKKGSSYYISLSKEKKTTTMYLPKLIYETFYNEKLSNNEIVRFKDEINQDKFHYTNLEKINRKDLRKNENHNELDKTKEWMIVKNFDDYKISNYGDIFSIKSNQMLKLTKDANGYYNIKLINNDGIKKLLIHRVVYDTFKGIIDSSKVIDHIDRNKTNNHINNLREFTYSENSQNYDRKEKELNKIHQYSLNNEFIKEWDSLEEIKEKLNYHSGNITNCYLGKSKSAYGFIWKNPQIITDLCEFKILGTIGDNKFNNYKINRKGIVINKNNIVMKPQINSGYYRISLINDEGKSVALFIHKLLGHTFIKNPNNYHIVNHIDENKLNNNIENLEWVNHTQNITHSQGKRINQIDIKTNKILKTYNSMNDVFNELNKKYGGNIRLVCQGKRTSAFGYKWSFAD